MHGEFLLIIYKKELFVFMYKHATWKPDSSGLDCIMTKMNLNPFSQTKNSMSQNEASGKFNYLQKYIYKLFLKISIDPH